MNCSERIGLKFGYEKKLRYEYLVNKFFDGKSLEQRTNFGGEKELFIHCLMSYDKPGFRLLDNVNCFGLDKKYDCPFQGEKDHNGLRTCIYEHFPYIFDKEKIDEITRDTIEKRMWGDIPDKLN